MTLKHICIFIFVFTSFFSLYSQTQLQEGNSCFERGDYSCAVNKFDIAFKKVSSSERQTIEIKLIRSKWCAEHLDIADKAYSNKAYTKAKEEYLNVLDSNPKDSYVISQIEKCNTIINPIKIPVNNSTVNNNPVSKNPVIITPQLRKATTAELTDIWNNKYGVKPQRQQNLINAGIDPDDAQVRINAGEGKPPEIEKIKLSVSNINLNFEADGKKSQQINVYTNASSFSVPLIFLPYWCSVKTFNDYFVITASANINNTYRKDWFKVLADNEEVKIYVEQSAGNPISPKENVNASIKKEQSKSSKQSTKCFNCPKTDDDWGITFGIVPNSTNDVIVGCTEIGIKYEPLFKYGFGLNTGINFEGYSSNVFDKQIFKNGFYQYGVNIPLHIEYRFNFSKWFNIYAYGGCGFNSIFNYNFIENSSQMTFESGAGFRINHVQFSIGNSSNALNLSDNQNLSQYKNSHQRISFFASYMF